MTELKKIIFCVNDKKLIPIPNELEMPKSIDEDEIIYVFNRGLTIEEEKQSNIFKYSFTIAEESLIFFTQLTEEKLLYDENLLLNFYEIKLLSDFFNTSGFLSMRINTLAEMKFNQLLTIFSSYAFTKTRDSTLNPSQILELEGFPLIDKLEYIIKNNSDSWSPSFEEIKDVSSKLNIPDELLSLLDKHMCVIAGGAAMYLGCPWSKWTLRCDVDFFVLDTTLASDLLSSLTAILLENKYKICSSSKSVLTCISFYGTRKIQIIRSAAKNVDELIIKQNGFDLNAIKCYYDGTYLHKTFGAEYDWLTRKCSGCTFMSVLPRRLLGIFWKGFKLTPQGIEYLNNTYGWPIPQEIIDNYESDIPFITEGVPELVQNNQLRLMNLPVVTDLTKTIAEIPVLFNHYGPSGTFIRSYEEYVNTVIIDNEERTISGGDLYKGKFIKIVAEYAINIPIGVLPFCYNSDTKEPEKQNNNKLNLSEEDYKKFHSLEQAIVDKSPIKVSALRKYGCNLYDIDEYNKDENIRYDIAIKFNRLTKFYANGISITENIIIDKNTKVSVVAFPKYIYNHTVSQRYYNMSYSKLTWKVVSVHYSGLIEYKKKPKIAVPQLEDYESELPKLITKLHIV